MKKYKGILIFVNLIILLGLFNFDVLKKEEVLEKGQLILLELAPVDPRSLMQGDFMRLRYAMAGSGLEDKIAKRGYCVVTLNDIGVGKRKRLQEDITPLHKNEFLIRYTAKHWVGINIGAESFFFQEGEGYRYEKAKYGGLKLDGKGNSILVGLYDENRKKIE